MDRAGLGVGPDAAQVHVHHAQARGVVDDLPAAQSRVRHVVELIAVEGAVAPQDVVVGDEQEAAGAGGGVADRVVGGGMHHVDDRLDERARREVLAGAGLRVLRVLFEQPLVDLALDVDVDPGLVLDEVDEAAELGGVLDAVLRLTEDDGGEAGSGAQLDEDAAVVGLKLIAVEVEQAAPVVCLGDGAGLAEKLDLLVVHLEEEQVGELLHVVAVGHAVVAQDVAVVPQALHDGR